jgi:hypothetical protein
MLSTNVEIAKIVPDVVQRFISFQSAATPDFAVSFGPECRKAGQHYHATPGLATQLPSSTLLVLLSNLLHWGGMSMVQITLHVLWLNVQGLKTQPG